MQKQAKFRFYEELNDYLPETKKKTYFNYIFKGNPTIKEVIENIGIPPVEADLILVNGKSVSYDYYIQNGDAVSVYPVFESIDISSVSKLREKPLRDTKFILDVHLGKLAKYLRMFGFDTVYKNYYKDIGIIKIAEKQKRIILSRDKKILNNKLITHRYLIKSEYPKEQIKEVIFNFDLYKKIKPFTRCLLCNGLIKKVSKQSIIDKLEPKTRNSFDDFYQCAFCKKVYWKGSHYERMMNFIKSIEKD